ncbi:MAG TPA: hypothetical protein VFC54_01995 [Pseudolabrys sp.]|nr:hypothetical protein [Pseudolabrys sp.]
MPSFSKSMHTSAGTILRAVASVGLIALLGGCSEYMRRSDAISLDAGDAVMTNRVTQMVDPWPRESANRDIAFNGERMEAAVERYRTGRVIQPAGIGTGSAYQAPQPQAPANTTPVGPTVTQSAPVK